jgi:hypothetical protein
MLKWFVCNNKFVFKFMLFAIPECWLRTAHQRHWVKNSSLSVLINKYFIFHSKLSSWFIRYFYWLIKVCREKYIINISRKEWIPTIKCNKLIKLLVKCNWKFLFRWQSIIFIKHKYDILLECVIMYFNI